MPDKAGEDKEEEEQKEKVRQTARFIQHMKENSFSEQLAIKALENIGDPSDLEEGKPIVTVCWRESSVIGIFFGHTDATPN